MEWRENLGVRVRGVGRHHRSTLLRHTVSNFNQGFTTCGRLAFASEGQVAEGFHGAVPIGTLDLAAVALPDDASMVVLQRYRSPPERTWLTCFQAVNALLPNDLWNGNRRSYVWEDGSKDCSGGAANDEEYIQTKSPWICCDNRIGFALIGDGLTFSLYHPGRRQIGLTKHDAWEDGPGYLACDELGVGRRAGLHEVPRDCNLADLAFVVVANGRPKPLQRVVQTARRLVSEGDLRMVEVPGQDGRNYLIAANFGDATLAVPIPQGATTLSLPAAADGQPVMLGAGQVGCWSLG
jgi:hypothetical protein